MLARGEQMPVVEREARGLCFRGAVVIVRYQGRRVYDIVRTGDTFEITMESLAAHFDLPGDTELSIEWPESSENETAPALLADSDPYTALFEKG